MGGSGNGQWRIVKLALLTMLGIIYWFVVYLPLWKIWKSVGISIPYIWKNKNWSKPPTSIEIGCKHSPKNMSTDSPCRWVRQYKNIIETTNQYCTWWLIPLSKWVITPIISGLTLLIPFITGVITHLLSGMSHQVASIKIRIIAELATCLLWPSAKYYTGEIEKNMIHHYWLVVSAPLKHMKVSWDMLGLLFPIYGKNKNYVPNHQPDWIWLWNMEYPLIN